MDSLVKMYIRVNLTYRFTEVSDSKEAFVIEDAVRFGALNCCKPLLNPK